MRGLVRNSYTLADTPEVPTFVVSFFLGRFFLLLAGEGWGYWRRAISFGAMLRQMRERLYKQVCLTEGCAWNCALGKSLSGLPAYGLSRTIGFFGA